MDLEDKKNLAMKYIQELHNMERSEDEEGELVVLINEICPDPNWIKHIYYSDDYVDEKGNLDVKGVVEKIFSYEDKPICL